MCSLPDTPQGSSSTINFWSTFGRTKGKHWLCKCEFSKRFMTLAGELQVKIGCNFHFCGAKLVQHCPKKTKTDCQSKKTELLNWYMCICWILLAITDIERRPKVQLLTCFIGAQCHIVILSKDSYTVNQPFSYLQHNKINKSGCNHRTSLPRD